MNILDTIKAHKIKEVEEAKRLFAISDLAQRPYYTHACVSFSSAIRKHDFPAIIAEHKRKSPSKGTINTQSQLKTVVQAYEKHGAAGISVLSDTHFFGGSAQDVLDARQAVEIPILRKEFIVDAYQIHEAKALGADCILLIAEICSKEEIQHWTDIAHDLGLEVLMELHSEEELSKIPNNLDIIGVNNRNLKTFAVDIQKSIALLSQLPREIPKVAESGLKDSETLRTLKSAGFDAFLMGERFMRDPKPELSFKTFMHDF